MTHFHVRNIRFKELERVASEHHAERKVEFCPSEAKSLH